MREVGEGAIVTWKVEHLGSGGGPTGSFCTSVLSVPEPSL